jgi:hypothetical protein
MLNLVLNESERYRQAANGLNQMIILRRRFRRSGAYAELALRLFCLVSSERLRGFYEHFQSLFIPFYETLPNCYLTLYSVTSL